MKKTEPETSQGTMLFFFAVIPLSVQYGWGGFFLSLGAGWIVNLLQAAERIKL